MFSPEGEQITDPSAEAFAPGGTPAQYAPDRVVDLEAREITLDGIGSADPVETLREGDETPTTRGVPERQLTLRQLSGPRARSSLAPQ